MCRDPIIDIKSACAKRAPTLRDVAARSGYSKGLVSCVLRGDVRKASAATAARIVAAAQDLGYDPAVHHVARRLVMSRVSGHFINRVVSLFLSEDISGAAYFRTIYRGIRTVLRRERFGMLLDNPSYEEGEALLPLYLRGDIDGAVILSKSGFASTLRRLREQTLFGRRPVISLIDPVPDTSSVITDDRQGSADAVSHLLAQGHRHFLQFSQHSDSFPVAQRLLGYEDACRSAGLDPDVHLHYFQTDFNSARVDIYMENALALYPRTTAILARNDLHALEIIDYLRRHNIRVPEEMSVIGFDDTDPLLSPQGDNLLTSVRLPLEKVGECAAEMLLRHITTQYSAQEHKTFPTELVIRATTAPPLNR